MWLVALEPHFPLPFVPPLPMTVMGHWYPLMTICRWCRLSVELQGDDVSIKAPLKGPCAEMKVSPCLYCAMVPKDLDHGTCIFMVH